jgi:DNA-binding NtrC family response regulator
VEGVREDAAWILKSYPWPGNVRELRNVIERAVILAMSGWIEVSHLPAYVSAPEDKRDDRIVLPADISLAKAEREILVRTLDDARYNKAEAARRLGVDVKTIRHKMKIYAIEEP